MTLCPDCNSDTILTDTGNNIWVLGIVHDDTCPTLAALATNQKETN